LRAGELKEQEERKGLGEVRWVYMEIRTIE
jgi:hypothetical protein